MPALVYWITEALSALVINLPLAANQNLFHILWTLISGRLLQTRGALIPALAATGMERAAERALLLGAHLQFPGLGHVIPRGPAYRWRVFESPQLFS